MSPPGSQTGSAQATVRRVRRCGAPSAVLQRTQGPYGPDRLVTHESARTASTVAATGGGALLNRSACNGSNLSNLSWPHRAQHDEAGTSHTGWCLLRRSDWSPRDQAPTTEGIVMARIKFMSLEGTERKDISPELLPYAERMLPLVKLSVKHATGFETANRSIAEVIADLCEQYPYAPAKLVKSVPLHELVAKRFNDADVTPELNDKGRYMLPISESDWTCSSREAKQAVDAVWSAVLQHVDVSGWMLATGKFESEFPTRKAVEPHIEAVLRARFTALHGDDAPLAYVTVTGTPWEPAGRARAKALASLRTENGEDGREPGGEVDQTAGEQATTAKQDVPAKLASVLESLRSIDGAAFKGKGKVALANVNMLREIALHVAVMLDEATAKVDTRRAAAAEATEAA